MVKIPVTQWIAKKIRKCIGIVEDTDTAENSISAGKFVIWKGNSYTADSAITAGDTLADSGAGKNLTEVPDGIGNALNSNITTINSHLAGKTASGGWSYIELPNKLCICWNRLYFGNLSTMESGSLYIATTPQVDLPFTFASAPYFLAQRDAGEGFGGIIGNQAIGSKTKTPSYTIARPSSGTLYSVQLDILVIGVKA